MPFERILVVDDETIVCRSIEKQLRRGDYTVITVRSLGEAEVALKNEQFDLAFVDLRLPDGEGTELLSTLKQRPDAPFVVMMTGYATVESAVSCMRAGAFDYIIKPFSAGQIEITVKKAEQFAHALNVARFYSKEERGDSVILGQSAPIENVRRLIERVAPTQATVLIQGESGTGKELIASEIHRRSERARAPFIKVNCAAISESLIESEFFGHEKGAFTGAGSRRQGRFELADGGSILLDEISEIKPALQAKLLRVLQEKEFQRVGGNRTIQVDVRVLATTNRDLEKCVEAGEFREDLFYRLNVFPIYNPPLRERPEDIAILAADFLSRAARKHGVSVRGISPAGLEAMLGHDWPGNVRELQNTVERAVILTEPGSLIEPTAMGLSEPLQVAHAPESTAKGVDANGSGNASNGQWAFEADDIQPLAELEKRAILHALTVTKGNRTQAADRLGISIRKMRNKIRDYKEAGEQVPEHQ